MPKSSTVLIIRHAEKPESGQGLAPAGEQRAAAYTRFFPEAFPNFKRLGVATYLFAAADSEESWRPRMTLEPLASFVRLPLAQPFADKQYASLAKQIQGDPKYEGSTLLICWHHEHALPLAKDLGVESGRLPPQARWPSEWPDSVYGWVLAIAYDDRGGVDVGRTACMSEKLMYGDCGQEPPAL